MKKVISGLSFLLATTSFAGYIELDTTRGYANQSLPACNGTAEATIDNNNTQLNIVFRNVVNCSNFDIVAANGTTVAYPNQKLGGADRARSGSFTIPGSLIDYGNNQIRLLLRSNSGATSDMITVKVRALPVATGGEVGSKTSLTFSAGDAAREMRSCGGTVRAQRNGNQLNVIFSGVPNCSNFDILANNGSKVIYANTQLDGREGNYSGSRTIPQSVMDFGANKIRLKLKSNDNKTAETITVKF